MGTKLFSENVKREIRVFGKLELTVVVNVNAVSIELIDTGASVAFFAYLPSYHAILPRK